MARVNKDYMDKFYDYGIDFDSRTIYIDDVNENGVENVLKSLHLLELAAPNGDKPINIILNNTGGSIYQGSAIYDRIRACVNDVTITVYGAAESMGCIILQAADHRILAPNATVMFHEGEPEPDGNSYDSLENKWQYEKRFSKRLDDIIFKRIKQKHPEYSESKFRKLNKKDNYLTAEEAVAFGLADEVLDI